jgi:hypothetical protein
LQSQLRSLGFTLPIIVMTLKGDMETAVRAMKGGAVDFIEKPFNDEGLLGAINAALALDPGPTRDRESMEAAKRVARLSPRAPGARRARRRALDQADRPRSRHQRAHGRGAPRAHAGAAGNTLSRRSGSAGGDGGVGSCLSRGPGRTSPAGSRPACRNRQCVPSKHCQR